MNKDIFVFVYGSLKKGFANHCVIEKQDYVGPASLTGKYRMFSLGCYPGVTNDTVLSDPATIKGELYRVDNNGLFDLDLLEGNGSYYTRVKVQLDCGTSAWVYLLPAEEYPLEESIESGEWTEEWRNAV